MASDEKKLKGILDKHQKYLDAIHDGIVEGTEEGIKKGTAKGAKRAAWDVLKEECLPQGFMNISASDIEDIVRNLWALTKNIDGEITKAANKIIERNVKQYRDRLVVDIIKKFRGQKPELAFVLELVTQRENKVGELISQRLPNNPISSGIVKGVQTALRIGIDRSTQGFRNELKDKLEGVENLTGESQDIKTAQRVEQIKADSKSITRDAVAKVVEEIVYRLLKMMHKRVLTRLRKELGEKLIHKLEQKIGEITKQKMEQLFEKSTDRLIEEIGKDCVNDTSFVENIDSTFGNSAKESLKSLTKWLTPLKTLAITILILGSAGGAVLALLNLPTTTPPTQTLTTTTTITTTTTTTTTITVTFLDPNLEAAIREAISKPQGPIYVSDLEPLAELRAGNRDLSDLTGIENCINLRELELNGNNIIDISALIGLTNLSTLDLSGNRISYIDQLLANSGLSTGDTVDLSGNPLNTESRNYFIPQLEDRGVNVIYQP